MTNYKCLCSPVHKNLVSLTYPYESDQRFVERVKKRSVEDFGKRTSPSELDEDGVEEEEVLLGRRERVGEVGKEDVDSVHQPRLVVVERMLQQVATHLEKIPVMVIV